ncbi:PLP-dependent aminotransferase family protein [Paracoccus sediminicola]|uniref:aminotransferase-like domain-containing protein n=1 Tax=Paracoccus sediminicola TaxID=3017783 RepID=UPI0022EFFD09|nr:PLP-dependent aminotransferase family protein [Paracoccus sediminicola]WBU56293.1 PLP-dependent aminotransferase family protein [Paracoccus sediminicola]
MPDARGTLSARVIAELEGRIRSGAVAVGARLPSLRQAASQFGVSKNTMVEAYDHLVARGLLEARPGSGFYIRRQYGAPQPPDRPRLQEAVDAATLLSEQLERRFRTRIGEGRPPAGWIDGAVATRHLRQAIHGPGRSSGQHYDAPAGFLPLRETLTGMLAERSIPVDPGSVVLTLGGNHAFDLIIRQMVRPGDPVLVESPGYYPLFAKLKLTGARLIPVARTPDGPDPAQLSRAARSSGARLFFTQSLAHNPTASSLDLPTAHRILRVAEELGLTIVEDDIFGDLLPPSATRLAALDGLQRVLLVGSFAKTLSATLRVGYVTGPPALVQPLQALKMLTVVNSCGHTERVVHAVLADGTYRRHLGRLRRRIMTGAGQLRQSAQELGLRLNVDPGGGYYAWLELPAGIDDMELARRAAERDIFLAPGTIFMPEGHRDSRGFLRLNVGYADDPRFSRFLRDDVVASAKRG